jgi:hypothetical protein
VHTSPRRGAVKSASAFVELGDACVNFVDAPALGVAVASDRSAAYNFERRPFTGTRPPIANLHNNNNQLVVQNLVDDAVLSDADAPEVFGARELDAPRRTRVAGERQQRCRDHLSRLMRQLYELALSSRRQDDAVFSHSAIVGDDSFFGDVWH